MKKSLLLTTMLCITAPMAFAADTGTATWTGTADVYPTCEIELSGDAQLDQVDLHTFASTGSASANSSGSSANPAAGEIEIKAKYADGVQYDVGTVVLNGVQDPNSVGTVTVPSFGAGTTQDVTSSLAVNTDVDTDYQGIMTAKVARDSGSQVRFEPHDEVELSVVITCV